MTPAAALPVHSIGGTGMNMDDADVWTMLWRSFALRLLGAAAVGFAIGCGPDLWVLRRASPNPIAGRHVYALEPVHFEGLVVGFVPEPAWLAARTADQRNSWEVDKLAFNNRFAGELIRGTDRLWISNGPPVSAGAVIVRTRVPRIEPGCYYTCVDLQHAADVAMHVELIDTRGATLEEFVTHVRVDATGFNASIGGRMRAAADRLAAIVLAYLRARSGTA